MKHLKKHLSPPPTVPQTKRASPAQEKNEAGGYTFVVSPWELLMRFLVSTWWSYAPAKRHGSHQGSQQTSIG